MIMAELKNLKVSFGNEKEKEDFIKQSKAYYEKRDDGYYFEYENAKTLTERQASFKQNWKEFLYVLAAIAMIAIILTTVIVVTKHKPEPIIKTNTVVVTGNTYEVTLDTKKIPAIWNLVYYYDSTISAQSWAKLNQVRIDSDGIIRYNICTQWGKWDDSCTKFIEDKNDCYDGKCTQKCVAWDIPYDQCIDTSIISNILQWLKDGICNK